MTRAHGTTSGKCALCIFLLVSSGAGLFGRDEVDNVFQPGKFELALATDKPDCFLHEPIRFVLRATNTTEESELVLRRFAPILYFRREDGEWRKLHQYIVQRESCRDSDVPPACVDPHSTWTVASWSFTPKLDSAGTYEVSLRSTGENPVKITIVSPTGQEEEPAKLFSRNEILLFLGEENEEIMGKDAAQNCETILSEFPGSTYATYAAIALARYELACAGERSGHPAPASKELDLQRFDRFVQFVLDRVKEGPLHEEALELTVACRQFLVGRAQGPDKHKWQTEIIKVAEEFLTKYSEKNSPYAFEMERRRRYHQGEIDRAPGVKDACEKDQGQRVPRPSEPGKLIAQGFDKVPAGPRETLQRFWQAALQNDLATAFSLLSDDFVGIEGEKKHKRDGWEKALDDEYWKEMTISVRQVSEPNRYEWKAEGGKDFSWQGRLCVVTASASVRKLDLRTGKEREVSGSIEWALKEMPGGWQIVSERVDKADKAAKMQRLHGKPPFKSVTSEVRDNFMEWRISDGKAERSPFEEALKQVPPEHKDKLTPSNTGWMWGAEEVLDDGWAMKYCVRIWRKDEVDRYVPSRGADRVWLVEILVRLLPDEKTCVVESVRVTEERREQ